MLRGYNPGQNVWDKVPFSRIAAIFARSPLPPRCNVGRLFGKPFLTNNIAWGEGGGRIWPKERLFPCEKLIDGRGSAFYKQLSHIILARNVSTMINVMTNKITSLQISTLSAQQKANLEVCAWVRGYFTSKHSATSNRDVYSTSSLAERYWGEKTPEAGLIRKIVRTRRCR